ncbi:MAG: Flp pilus assembly protein CpaB, partial [Variovorax paradoxus]
MINLTKVIAAILVLLALALGGYAWMLSRQPPPPVAVAPSAAAPGKTVQAQTFPVVVAAKPLPAGQAIPADALRIERLTINPAGAFQETAPLAGRVPVIDLGEGSPLLQSQLVSGLALRVAEGERAIAIKADETMGVGNKVQPGDFVDVFLMLKSDSKDIDRSQARLLLSRKRVLAYGSASVDGLSSKMDKNGAAQQQAQRAEPARTAVLAVPVDEINRLTLAENSGRLLLALRNPTDMSEPDPKLFAELPTALQPPPLKAGEPRRPPLEGLDRAQAGV